MAHADTVQQIYAAFGRGDIPSILDRLAEDVDWEYDLAPNDIPYLQRRRGRAEVGAFFQALDALEFERFEVHTIVEQGALVVGLANIELRVKATGRRIHEEDETHLWWFDAQGRVARFAHKVDTLAHWKAHHGEAVGAAAAAV